MIPSRKRTRKASGKQVALPAGVKVVRPPRSVARRRLLSGPDIATSGGSRTVHSRSADR
ncbi:MAG TPA: hypothetical protein VK797_24755 [Tepidisphaeraceae bacterium]|nr:hypothetical protein [Tepidisphaeraceae bacterium]